MILVALRSKFITVYSTIVFFLSVGIGIGTGVQGVFASSINEDNITNFQCFAGLSDGNVLLLNKAEITNVVGGSLMSDLLFSTAGGFTSWCGLAALIYCKDYIKSSILRSKGKHNLVRLVHRKSYQDLAIGTAAIIGGTVISMMCLSLISIC